MRYELGEPAVIEPAVVIDTFATGVLPPEDRGGHIRIVLYADRRTGDGMERVIVARIVFARDDFMAALSKVVEGTTENAAMLDLTGTATH